MSSEFLVEFHKQHFADTSLPIYSKEMFYALLEELKKFHTLDLNRDNRS